MRPQIHAPHFDFAGSGDAFGRMARVLRWSAEQHCPNWDIHVEPAEIVSHRPFNKSANASKLKVWTDIVDAAPDDTRLLLMDSDMLIQAPLDDIWDREFEIAFTHRPDRARMPINGGVVFVRANHWTRLFFKHWLQVNVDMLNDRPLHRKWKATYGGMNQAALGMMIGTKHEALDALNTLWLPCSEWNAADHEWVKHWRSARILHVKGGLRRAIFTGERPLPIFWPVVKHWLAMEKRASE